MVSSLNGFPWDPGVVTRVRWPCVTWTQTHLRSGLQVGRTMAVGGGSRCPFEPRSAQSQRLAIVARREGRAVPKAGRSLGVHAQSAAAKDQETARGRERRLMLGVVHSGVPIAARSASRKASGRSPIKK